MALRVSAISFLNPAPLLYNFEHPPAADGLRRRYHVHYSTPSQCAAELHAGAADLGLIPIAELDAGLSIVPGCTIASLKQVRSILLLVRNPGHKPLAEALRSISTIAADTASRSSAAYVRVILERFYGVKPKLVEHRADPTGMLAAHDAALLIGDPALLAREHRAQIEESTRTDGPKSLLWLDLAEMWREHTGLPWVAAVWAVRPQTLAPADVPAAQLIADLNASREAGQAHIEDLVTEWTPRLELAPETIRSYLTRNIHYHLDEACIEAIRTFRQLAAETGVLPPLPRLALLER